MPERSMVPLIDTRARWALALALVGYSLRDISVITARSRDGVEADLRRAARYVARRYELTHGGPGRSSSGSGAGPGGPA